jgi:hypothetical protein
MAGDTNSMSPKSNWQCHNRWVPLGWVQEQIQGIPETFELPFSTMLIVATTILVVNTGGTSPSLVHSFTVWLRNFDWGSKLVCKAMWS